MNSCYLNRSLLRCLWAMLAAILISQAIGNAQSPANRPSNAALARQSQLQWCHIQGSAAQPRRNPSQGAQAELISPHSRSDLCVCRRNVVGATDHCRTIDRHLQRWQMGYDTYCGSSYAALLVKATYLLRFCGDVTESGRRGSCIHTGSWKVAKLYHPK